MDNLEARKRLNNMHIELGQKKKEVYTDAERESIDKDREAISYAMKALMRNQEQQGEQLTIS